MSRLLSEPLPAGRPLWTIHLVEHFHGGSAVVARIHHCIGDGLALVHVLLSMADGALRSGAARRVRPGASWAMTLGEQVLRGARALLAHPGRIGDLARLASGSAGSLLGLLALPDDPPTGSRGRWAGRRSPPGRAPSTSTTSSPSAGPPAPP